MSTITESEASNHSPPPAGTGAAQGEEHELTQIQKQEITSPVHSYPKLFELEPELRFERRLEDRKNDFTDEERGEAWKKVDAAVKTYSDEMVERWIAEMDTLLVYAGLFSAVLTAFNVESYSLLSPPAQPAPDPVLAALTQISAQLASFSVHDPFVNSTQSAFQPSLVASDPSAPQRWAVWLNILWFSSLICSLSAAFVAIMVKQWLHEYKSGISGSSRNTARLRQHRYNGLVKWKVATIIAVLPVLLQIASGLFMAGLLVLLWNLNRTVAIVASSLVGVLLAFTVVTIILPTFTSNCAYLSPLSILLFRSCRIISAPLLTVIYKKADSVFHKAPLESKLERISFRVLQICRKLLVPSVHAMQSAYVTRNPPKLDQDIFVTAYSTTGDLGLLEQASTCFSDHSIDNRTQFLTRIHAQNREYGQTDSDEHWTHDIPLDMASDMLLVRAWNTSSASGETSGQHILSLQPYMWLSRVVSGDHRISCALSNMAAVLYNNGDRHPDDFPMFECLLALRRQIDSVKEANSALTDDVRRRVIAAIFTAVRTSMLNASMDPERSFCVDILVSCSSPSISRSQPVDTAEEDTRRKPLADAIVLAEDALITTLQFPQFLDGGSVYKCRAINFFFDYYRRIGREQLASRVSERLLRTLKRAVQNRTLGGGHEWTHHYFDEAWKNGLLEWLKSLEKERDKQFAVGKDERTDTSSRIA